MAATAHGRSTDARIAGFTIVEAPGGFVRVRAVDDAGTVGTGAGAVGRDGVAAWCGRLVGTPLFAETQRWAAQFASPDAAAGAALAGFGIAETALADLASRRLGVPLHDWLGGRVRDAIDTIVPDTASRGSADSVLIAAAGDWRGALSAAARIRAADGPMRRIVLDLDCGLAETDRPAFVAAADPLLLDLVIDPARVDDVAAAKALRMRAPVAARVALPGLDAVARALERGLVQALVIDPVAWGGPPGVRRVAALARVFQASLHLDARASDESAALAAHLAVAFPTVAGVVAKAAPLAAPNGAGVGVDTQVPAGTALVIGTVVP